MGYIANAIKFTISLFLVLLMMVSSNGLVCEMVTSPSPYCLRVMVSLSIRGAHATTGPPTINNNNRTSYNKQQHLLQYTTPTTGPLTINNNTSYNIQHQQQDLLQ